MNKRQRKKYRQKQEIIYKKLMKEAVQNAMARQASEGQTLFSVEWKVQ